MGVAFDIAHANGIRPDDALRVPIAGSQFEASVIWRLHTLTKTIDVGRIADHLRSTDFKPDEEVIVIPTRDRVEFHRVDETEDNKSGPAQIEATPLTVNDPLLQMLGDP